jgi:hypothetical protein
MDENCQSVLQHKLDDRYRKPDGALWIILALFDSCVLIVGLFKFHQLRSTPTSFFNTNCYLRTLCASMFFFALANYVRGIHVLVSTSQVEANQLLSQYFGNVAFAFWQLAYSIAVCFQVC